jgi:hypothetical protein
VPGYKTLAAGRLIGVLAFCALVSGLQPVPASSPGVNYLPFDPGRKWVLRSPSSSAPVILEVLNAKAGEVRLRFDSPWISSEFRLNSRNGRAYITAVTMNGQTADLPSGTLYWDTTAQEKQKWSSPIGQYQVVSRHKKVRAMHRDFQDCVEIEETNKQGNRLYWTFAPDAGFVQFGDGPAAFILQSVTTESVSKGADSQFDARADRPSPGSAQRSGAIRVALAANPFANEAYGPRAVQARFRQARDAGVNLIYISPKWNEIETGREKYKLDDVVYQIGEAAQENLPAILHVRVIDTNQRAMPADLMGQPFDAEQIGTRLDHLFDALLPRLQGRVKYFLVGNEIDAYFNQHTGEVQAFSKLVARASAHIRKSVPDAQISVSTTIAGIEDAVRLRPILDQTTFFALTYYPLSSDFVVRDPSTVNSDFPRILAAAGSKQIFLQEVGYPSSASNDSSEDKQAEFFSLVLDRVRSHPDRFIGVNFTFMSDFSDSLVKSFSAYYGASGADRFASFLKSLGMFDDRGRPKKAWAVFERKVSSLK